MSPKAYAISIIGKPFDHGIAFSIAKVEAIARKSTCFCLRLETYNHDNAVLSSVALQSTGSGATFFP